MFKEVQPNTAYSKTALFLTGKMMACLHAWVHPTLGTLRHFQAFFYA